jgi:hypothetical protein
MTPRLSLMVVSPKSCRETDSAQNAAEKYYEPRGMVEGDSANDEGDWPQLPPSVGGGFWAS